MESIVGEAWNYLEDLFINSIVLSNCKLPYSCVSQIPQLHILLRGTGRPVQPNLCATNTHTDTDTNTDTDTDTNTDKRGSWRWREKNKLKEIGGQILGVGPQQSWKEA